MNKLAVSEVLVVRSATQLEIELLKRKPPLIEFDDDAARFTYEKLDRELAQRLHTLAEAACTDLRPEHFVFTNWDWHPCESRAITVDRRIVSIELVNALLAALNGEHASWRIHLNVVENLAGNATEYGSACLLKDIAILEQSLCHCLDVPVQTQ